MPEHVGRVSDAIDHEVEGGARARLSRVMKPSGKTFKGTSEVGDGDRCPVEGHGKKYKLTSGTQWCPNQSHDNERMKAK